MTTLHLVRHGPTHQKTFVGWRDVPADLSDTAQIARLHAHLPSDAILVSSDLIRASATADAVQDGRNRLPHDPNLREFNFGDWDGQHFSEIAANDPEASRAYWENPGDTAPPNGESWNAASARISKAIDRLCKTHSGADIVIVAHIGAILTQVQRALLVSAHDVLAHKIDNLSVTDISVSPDAWTIGRINHLP